MWSAKKTPAEVAAEKVNALCEHAYAGSLVATKVAVTAETDANQTATAGICKGLTPLCSAAKGNTDTDEVVKYLLDHRTKIVPAKTGKLVFHTEVNMMADGRAPLHYAAAAGNAKIVKMLLEQNADVDLLATGPATAAHKGKTPLFLAVTNTQINVSKLAIDEREELKKHGNVVKILLAHNADVKSTFDFKIGLEKRKEDWTVLHEAVEKLDHDMVKAILSSVDGKGLLAATAKITGSVQENVFSFRTPYDVALHKATNAKDEKQKQLADKIEQTLKEEIVPGFSAHASGRIHAGDIVMAVDPKPSTLNQAEAAPAAEENAAPSAAETAADAEKAAAKAAKAAKASLKRKEKKAESPAAAEANKKRKSSVDVDGGGASSSTSNGN